MGRKPGRRRAAFKLKFKKETAFSIASLTLIAAGCLIIISFAGKGLLLEDIHKFLRTNFGLSMLLVPYLLITAGLMLTRLKLKITRPNVFLGGVLLFITAMGLFKAGEIGQAIFLNLAALIQPLGASIILLGIGLVGFLIITESSLDEIFLFFANLAHRLNKAGQSLGKNTSSNSAAFATSHPGIKIKGVVQPPANDKPVEKPSTPVIKASPAPETKNLGLTNTPVLNAPVISGVVYQPPSDDLLVNELGGKADRGDVKANASVIERTLDSFGIKARVVEVNLGPAVTQYALEIASGTKLTRITALQNDLALALAAPTGQIRIEAPIPGRSMVGIEIPNRLPEMVTLKQVLTSSPMKKAKGKLAVGLGLSMSGEVSVVDIAKMPHILIAGSTGSGKSVSVNAFILQILFRASPEEVKFILVDPKRVELTQYNGIPHLLTPVIVEPEKVVAALQWAIGEMEKRYKLFAEVGVRNIASYNELSGFQALPYIVIIIDELADVMLFNPNKVEDSITRLAQMARATGIHLILATQRPSVDVLTGLIKANIPCRIAFNVTTMIDSRVIIDSPGAEKLLGRGDMLFIPPDQAKPSRIQGTYVSDPEIKKILDYVKQIGIAPQYTEEVTSQFAPKKIVSEDGIVEDQDDMFDDAVKIITRQDKASASLLQRRLSIGYARAARILDQMEKAGIVAPAVGSKPREVLIKDSNGVNNPPTEAMLQ
jgi:DNA segregation ATPase FtsK/SpoIIIE, S-DNA-T family